MPCQLPADCLNEIFEYLEEDKITLHSCLLVSRLWCEVSVRILWKNIWNFNTDDTDSINSILSQISNTLIACLTDESKDFLYKYGIFISTPPPLFNYVSFCKVLSIYKTFKMIKIFFKNQQSIAFNNLNDEYDDYDKRYLVMQEVLEMFMKQVSSLEKLTYFIYDFGISKHITFTHFPEARDCLTNLSELACSTYVGPGFFYQLSQICHNIQSLYINLESTIPNSLNNLISSQSSIKYLSTYGTARIWADLIPSIMKHSNTLIKLKIKGAGPESFISFINFTNLQKLVLKCLSFDSSEALQYATFPQLQIFKFKDECLKVKPIIKFLKVNGMNLKEFHIESRDDSLNLAIAKFCPNLKSLFTLSFKEIEPLKVIFNSCQQLESMKVLYDVFYFKEKKEKEILEVVAKHSPENFHELKFHYSTRSELLSKDLESFFINWKNRIPQKSFSLIISRCFNVCSFAEDDENMKIIEKYKKLSIIKKFDTSIKKRILEYYDS